MQRENEERGAPCGAPLEYVRRLNRQPRGRIAVRSWYGCISQPGLTGT
jgi:hypothetical protein